MGVWALNFYKHTCSVSHKVQVAKMKKYRLEVVAHGKPGFYESPTLLGLLWTRFRHQLNHFCKHGKWSD